MYGNDYNYTVSRLERTIIRTRSGVLIYVKSVGIKENGTLYLSVKSIPQGRCFDVDLDQVNLKPLPLGFFNIHKESVYFSRTPLRNDWRQGTRAEQIYTNKPVVIDFLKIGKELYNCVNDKYPSFSKSMDYIFSGFNSVAFNKVFSLSKCIDGIMLNYKVDIVGYIDADNGEIKLSPSFRYLNERLESCVHG